MKNFKGLHTYAVGGINTFDFALGNAAKTSIVKSNPSKIIEAMSGFGDKKPKQSKKAKRNTPNQGFRENCFKRN